MKTNVISRLLTLIALFAITLPGYAQGNNSGKKFICRGIAFYNLENLFDTINNNGNYDLEFSPNGARQWNSQKYELKINNLARVIANMVTTTTPSGPAVIGVSEIENRSVLVDLCKAVDNYLIKEGKKPWNLQIVHHDSPDRRGVDVSLLYNPRQFRVIDVTNARVDIGYPTRDQMCVTGVLSGDTISVIVNHWPSRLGGEEKSSPNREKAAARCKETADSIWAIRPGQPIIIMGDLNDDPQNKSCAQVLGAKKDTKGVGIDGFYNPWWKMLDKGIGTLAYKGQWNLFDQIIVSGGLLEENQDKDANKFHYWKCQVNNFDFLKDTKGNRQNYPLRTFSGGVFLGGYSDHFPTEIFLIKEAK